jgi:hypothetical protein
MLANTRINTSPGRLVNVPTLPLHRFQPRNIWLSTPYTLGQRRTESNRLITQPITFFEILRCLQTDRRHRPWKWTLHILEYLFNLYPGFPRSLLHNLFPRAMFQWLWPEMRRRNEYYKLYACRNLRSIVNNGITIEKIEWFGIWRRDSWMWCRRQSGCFPCSYFVPIVSSARILFTRVTSVNHYSSKILFLLLRTAVSYPQSSTIALALSTSSGLQRHYSSRKRRKRGVESCFTHTDLTCTVAV